MAERENLDIRKVSKYSENLTLVPHLLFLIAAIIDPGPPKGNVLETFSLCTRCAIGLLAN